MALQQSPCTLFARCTGHETRLPTKHHTATSAMLRIFSKADRPLATQKRPRNRSLNERQVSGSSAGSSNDRYEGALLSVVEYLWHEAIA